MQWPKIYIIAIVLAAKSFLPLGCPIFSHRFRSILREAFRFPGRFLDWITLPGYQVGPVLLSADSLLLVIHNGVNFHLLNILDYQHLSRGYP